MPIITTPLTKTYHLATTYINSAFNFIIPSDGLLYRVIRENKKSTGIAIGCSILYGFISYTEFRYFTQISTNLNEYKSVFSLFAKEAPSTKTVHSSISFLFEESHKTCSAAEGKLSSAITKGQLALAQYAAMVFCKPLLLEACRLALTFSLRSALIREWLANHNNQLGLQLLDKDLSAETREIIDQYSRDLVAGILGRISILLDFIITLGKAYDIYQIANNLTTQGLEVNLLAFISLIIGAYLLINVGLNIIFKAYSELAREEQLSFKNDLTFNMNNALQIESSDATQHEFTLLNLLLAKITKTEILQTILGISMTTVGMIFTNFISFGLLSFSIPSIVKNPPLYFSIENMCTLLRALCINLWTIFDKVSSSATMSYSYKKINNFFQTVEQYRTLLKRQTCQFTISTTSNLSCELTISYPEDFSNANSSNRTIVNNFIQEFLPGKIYAVTGPSGSGKSSFFKALAGINPFAMGKITITNRENIIYIPQKPIFKQGLSWMQTILYPLDEKKYSSVEAQQDILALQQNILSWIQALKIENVYKLGLTGGKGWTSDLSGGEAQRLLIIQALAKTWLRRKERADEQILLLLDETLNALDPEMEEKALQLLVRHVQEHNITTLHIDHSDPIIMRRRYAEDHIIDFSFLKSS